MRGADAFGRLVPADRSGLRRHVEVQVAADRLGERRHPLHLRREFVRVHLTVGVDSRKPAMKAARTRASRLACPLTSGTWLRTALTRRSIAATTRTWPPEWLLPQIPIRPASTCAHRSISWRGSPSLAPKLRLSNASALSPAPAKSPAKLSRYISLDRGEAVRHDEWRPGRATGAVRGLEPAS